jgi:hypothetical protein
MREKTRVSALKHLSLYRRGAKTYCSVAPTEDGRFTVRCRITEKGSDLMDTTVTVLSEQEAERIRMHFNERPEEVLRGIVSVLSGKIEYYMG